MADHLRTDLDRSFARSADALLEKGDMDRYAVSKPIVKAVQWLFREETRGEAISIGKLLL